MKNLIKFAGGVLMTPRGGRAVPMALEGDALIVLRRGRIGDA